MSKIRSLPRFCIGLSAAVLLTGGLASANDDNMPNHRDHNLHSGFFAELNNIASPFKALGEHIRREEARKEQERLDREYNELLWKLWARGKIAW